MTADAKIPVNRPFNGTALASFILALLPPLFAVWLPLLRGQELDMMIDGDGLLFLCIGVPVEIVAIVLGHLAIRAGRLKSTRGSLLGVMGLGIGYAVAFATIVQTLAILALLGLLSFLFGAMGG